MRFQLPRLLVAYDSVRAQRKPKMVEHLPTQEANDVQQPQAGRSGQALWRDWPPVRGEQYVA